MDSEKTRLYWIDAARFVYQVEYGTAKRVERKKNEANCIDRSILIGIKRRIKWKHLHYIFVWQDGNSD